MAKKRIREAKNWKVCEAVSALREGVVEARIDLATRFPLFTTATDEEILDEITLMTARQVEIRMRKKMLGGAEESGEDIATEQMDKSESNFVPDSKEQVEKPVEKKVEQVEEDTKEEAEEVEVEEVEKDIDEEDLDDLFGDLED